MSFLFLRMKFFPVILFLFFGMLLATAQDIKLLFIGDSLTYTNGMPNMVEEMGKSFNPPRTIVVSQHTRGGNGLFEHWTKGIIKRIIEEGEYDIIVLEDTLPGLERNDFTKCHLEAIEFVRVNNAQPLVYMTWEMINRLSYPIELINEVYHEISRETDVAIAPVGLAFAEIKEKHPEVRVIKEDAVHPTQYGSYLVALIIFSSIWGDDPRNVVYNSTIPPDIAADIKKIAYNSFMNYGKTNTPIIK